MSVYIYERKRLENWVSGFCSAYSEIHGGEIISKFSEHDVINGYCFNREFEFFLKNNVLFKSSFDEEEGIQIIKRCRLLRSLELSFANKLLLAAEYSVEKFIFYCNPTLFIAPRIDSYILDILDRKLSKNNIPYIGLWRSAFLNNRFFLTKRGEFNAISEYKLDDVTVVDLINSISNSSFKATSITHLNQFSLVQLIKSYSYLFLRDVFLEFKRNLGLYKFGYRELTNRFNVKESSPSLKGVLFPFYFKNFNFDQLNVDFDKNVFIALQVNPESTIDYYSSNLEFIDIENTLMKLINTLSPFGYKFFIKDHPNMFAKRDFLFLKEIFSFYKNVFLVPYEFSSNILIEKCNFVFTWSGTVCIQAFLSDRVPITVCSPYNLNHDKFLILKDFEDFNSLSDSMLKAKISLSSRESKRLLVSKILSSLLPGSVYLHNNKKFNKDEIMDLIYTLKNNKII